MSLGTGSDRDEALRRAVCITAGVIVAKQLVAAPANVLTPGVSAVFLLATAALLLVNNLVCISVLLTLLFDYQYGFCRCAC